ncbi:MAG: ABC transporter substrate-binding protein [Methanobrevibacter arboriphilus]|uniref:ABC transporter substrate-binding protein n=1 Tax=Methanobrevibacter arboriphilus TaxID=39441 RepID=A0A843AC39_METAZ|nr:ABC transporter substrate-binding protein [Methanobrevibacter arboriphilus]MBF4468522.1 ABC transporter substrate-binding protein [Methanobrevibacter arboriphilus]
MANKKLIAIVIVIIAIIAIIAGLLFLPSSANANSINGAVTKDCSGTPWFVGYEKGFFDKHNVNVVDKGDIPYAQQPAALSSGELNVYDGHPNALINLIKSGVPVKAVVVTGAEPINGSLDEEHMHWLVKENSSLKSPEDFEKFVKDNGRKVKVGVLATGVCADLETNAWLRKNNITPNDTVEYVTLPDNQQEQALLQGDIDIATLHPPFFAKAEKDSNETNDSSKKLRILTTSTEAFGPAAGLSFAIVNEDFIKEHPDTVRNFIKAFKDADRWSNDNREEAGEITAKNIDLPYTANVHWYSPSGAIDEEVKGYIQDWIDAMEADGLIEHGEFVPEDLYTTEFNDTWDTSLPNQ